MIYIDGCDCLPGYAEHIKELGRLLGLEGPACVFVQRENAEIWSRVENVSVFQAGQAKEVADTLAFHVTGKVLLHEDAGPVIIIGKSNAYSTLAGLLRTKAQVNVLCLAPGALPWYCNGPLPADVYVKARSTGSDRLLAIDMSTMEMDLDEVDFIPSKARYSGPAGRVFMYIDGDNISFKLLEKMVSIAAAKGSIAQIKIYGNANTKNGWAEAVKPLDVPCMFGQAEGKDAADERMREAVIKDVGDQMMDTCVIASGDKGFGDLVKMIRRQVYTVGIMRSNSSGKYRDLFDEYHVI